MELTLDETAAPVPLIPPLLLMEAVVMKMLSPAPWPRLLLPLWLLLLPWLLWLL